MSDVESVKPIGPRPRRRGRPNRGDWALFTAMLVIWGVVTGSPNMRPREAVSAPPRVEVAPTAPVQVEAPQRDDEAEDDVWAELRKLASSPTR